MSQLLCCCASPLIEAHSRGVANAMSLHARHTLRKRRGACEAIAQTLMLFHHLAHRSTTVERSVGHVEPL
jgi:hypothetical protein